MTDFGPIAWIAVVYEILVGISALIVVILSFQRYKKKHNKLFLRLILSFLFYDIAVWLTLISKIINAVWGGVPYEMLGDAGLWWMGRLHAGRFAFVSIMIATLILYHFKVEIFGDSQYKKYYQYSLYAYTAISIVFLIIYYEFNTDTGKANQFYEFIGFILVLFMTIIVNVPFLIRSMQISRKVEELKMKKKLNALSLMATGYILIFVCFTLDRLMLIFFNWAYSIFYFLGWVFVLSAVITGYLGYLKRD